MGLIENKISQVFTVTHVSIIINMHMIWSMYFYALFLVQVIPVIYVVFILTSKLLI